MKSHACRYALEVELAYYLRRDSRARSGVHEEAVRVIANERLAALGEHSDSRRAVLPSAGATVVRSANSLVPATIYNSK